MIFTLTDETYSVNSSITYIPENVNEPKARLDVYKRQRLYLPYFTQVVNSAVQAIKYRAVCTVLVHLL